MPFFVLPIQVRARFLDATDAISVSTSSRALLRTAAVLRGGGQTLFGM